MIVVSKVKEVSLILKPIRNIIVFVKNFGEVNIIYPYLISLSNMKHSKLLNTVTHSYEGQRSIYDLLMAVRLVSHCESIDVTLLCTCFSWMTSKKL